ncbi:MAG TPA: DUF3995 domain-containing protein [Hyphomicrobiaceae bacterium]|jgi:hypothetical protein|nr:DUF3995 domain-containing protein [Hyphomicrobiaceae bacterium]
MIAAIAIVLSVVMACIALLHAYWGLGGIWPASSAERLARAAVGTPGIRKMPGTAACLAVAALLLAVASWPSFALRLVPEAWPHWLTLLAGLGIAGVFLGRGLAGYTTAWRRRFSEQPFARLDRIVYSPLCLALGAGFIVLLLRGPQ